MSTWAVSVLASGLNVNVNSHSVFLVEALSRDEATGKAFRVAEKAYPRSEGWFDHHVMVCPSGNVIDPEKEISLKDE